MIKPENIAITHAFGSGGTTLTKELEKKIPQNKRLVTYDAARFYLENQGKKSNDLKEKERVDLQLFVIASSIGAVMHAERARIMALMDNSCIEALAYCQDLPMKEEIIDKVYEKLSEYRKHTVAYVLPPTIPLENDGLRYSDKKFRVVIHERIMQIIEAFDIPHHIVLSQTPKSRAEEVLHLHRTHHGFI